MKIIAKECPKCGAPLKFKVGDRDVHCEHCRMDFAIEYDDGKEEYVPEDFILSPEDAAYLEEPYMPHDVMGAIKPLK